MWTGHLASGHEPCPPNRHITGTSSQLKSPHWKQIWCLMGFWGIRKIMQAGPSGLNQQPAWSWGDPGGARCPISRPEESRPPAEPEALSARRPLGSAGDLEQSLQGPRYGPEPKQPK